MPLTKAQISHLRGLRLKKNREAAGQFIVEGPKVVSELINAGHRFTAVYATPEWTSLPEIACTHITPEEMTRISHYPTASPVLAVGDLFRASLVDHELNAGYTLVLDGIQDPGNVGTLIRVADWFGCHRIILSPDCADLFSQKVINASMGSFARLRTVTTDLAPALSASSVPVLGCDLTGVNIHSLTPPPNAVVVIGSEGRGLSPAVAATLTQRVTIPRHGHAESLNAGVAAGIVCAHLRR
ncbi:MAG: RNA methyltransferase [Candidatus Synoicihabitans palmerolidicus]|nr:RNA methyltransferase [Candidatus Synoicihabitans palmerolidicus]